MCIDRPSRGRRAFLSYHIPCVVIAAALLVAFTGSSPASAQHASSPPPGYVAPPGYIPPPGYVPPPGTVPGQAVAQPGAGGPGGMPAGGRPAGAAMKPKVVGKGYIKYTFTSDDTTVPDQSTKEEENLPRVEKKVYTIQTGDCLWNLAGSFLSDVWRWRELWEQNRYILNPDLIYPGNELALGESVVDPSPLLDSTFLKSPRDFGDATAGFLDDTVVVNQDSIDLAEKETAELAYINAIVKKKILTKEFLAGTPFLWMERDARGLVYPGDARVDLKARRSSYQQYDEVPITPVGSIQYSVGDTVEVFRSERMVNYKDKKANLVRRIATGLITAVEGSRVRAKLLKVADVVQKGDRVGPKTAFERISVRRYTEPGTALSAKVFERVEQTLFPYLYHTFIIDRGSSGGVELGDLFLAFVDDEDKGRQAAQLACAVHVGEEYATLATVMLYKPSLDEGAEVALVRRMESE